jgi:hypothetical protein
MARGGAVHHVPLLASHAQIEWCMSAVRVEHIQLQLGEDLFHRLQVEPRPGDLGRLFLRGRVMTDSCLGSVMRAIGGAERRSLVAEQQMSSSDYPRSELTIIRYASSGNAFIDTVRTLPSCPNVKMYRAAMASSGAS